LINLVSNCQGFASMTSLDCCASALTGDAATVLLDAVMSRHLTGCPSSQGVQPTMSIGNSTRALLLVRRIVNLLTCADRRPRRRAAPMGRLTAAALLPVQAGAIRFTGKKPSCYAACR
jgi:hypothetical protein